MIPHGRALNVACRTAHLAAFALLVGGHAWGVSAERLLSALWLTVASGLGLVALELAQTARWLLEARGLLVALKIALLLAIPWAWDYRVPILLTVVVIASVGAHMPGRFRHASLVSARGRSWATPPPGVGRDGVSPAMSLGDFQRGEQP